MDCCCTKTCRGLLLPPHVGMRQYWETSRLAGTVVRDPDSAPRVVAGGFEKIRRGTGFCAEPISMRGGMVAGLRRHGRMIWAFCGSRPGNRHAGRWPSGAGSSTTDRGTHRAATRG